MGTQSSFMESLAQLPSTQFDGEQIGELYIELSFKTPSDHVIMQPQNMKSQSPIMESSESNLQPVS